MCLAKAANVASLGSCLLWRCWHAAWCLRHAGGSLMGAERSITASCVYSAFRPWVALLSGMLR